MIFWNMLLLCSYFIPSLFCRIGVAPFISSLSVGFIMVLASIVLVFTIEKVMLCHYRQQVDKILSDIAHLKSIILRCALSGVHMNLLHK